MKEKRSWNKIKTYYSNPEMLKLSSKSSISLTKINLVSLSRTL